MLDKIMDWVERKAGPDRPGRIRGWIANALGAAGVFLILWALLTFLP